MSAHLAPRPVASDRVAPAGSAMRFPSRAFRSVEAFRAFRSAEADLLDTRYARERALGSHEDLLHADGTCGPCLAATRFASETAAGETTPDGRRVPNWREQQRCGCAHRLCCRERALLHLAFLHLGDPGWFRAALLGEPGELGPALAARLGPVALWPRLQGAPGAQHLPAPDASLHMLLCPDHLHHVPDLDAALAEAARVLSPGGTLLFTVPFHAGADATATDNSRLPRRAGALPAFSAEPVHRIGWDILERVRGAGFPDCAAHCFWSEELGYLGALNMIFLAAR